MPMEKTGITVFAGEHEEHEYADKNEWGNIISGYDEVLERHGSDSSITRGRQSSHDKARRSSKT